jgi:aryl-alcohol dehydrogenase-like predicted oxidoreductase
VEQRVFGTTGLHVPVVGMGTWHTFDVTGKDAEERTRVVDTALKAGATLFDSSPMYGEAERVLGRALRGRRDRAIVATKVWASSDREAQNQITASLAYFRRQVDIYQVHNLVAWRARLDQLQRLRDSGVVRAIGVTHYSAGAADDLLRAMKDPRVRAVQIPYNPRERWVESSVLPAAADLALGVIVMRPFGEGALLRMRVSKSALEPLKLFGISSWPQALLKWILSDARCHVAIPATSSPEHLHANAAAGEPPWLGPDERKYIAALAGHSS